MSIFRVQSNLNHNGTRYEVGSFFQGEISAFESLVKDGVLRVMEADTIEQAQEIIDSELNQAPEATVETAKPADTWGPQPDKEPEAPQTPTTDNVPANGDTTQVEAPASPQGQTVEAPKAPENAGDNL